MPQKASWKEHYWFSVPIMKLRIEKIIEAVQPQGKSIVEVGCNEGFLSKAFLENGASNVVPVDYDQSMCDKTMEMFGLTATKASIMDLPFEDKSFDIAVGCEVLEHISNPFKGLSELFRVARDKVVVTVPVGEYWAGEPTHQWILNGAFMNHDNLEIYSAGKDILILCFHRIRNENFVDIPPFETKALREKHGIR